MAEMVRFTAHAAHWLGDTAHHIEHDVLEALHHAEHAREAAVLALGRRQPQPKTAVGKQLTVPAPKQNGFALLVQPLKWSRSARTLLAGAGSAAVSKTATSPLEVLRIKMMTGGKSLKLVDVVRDTWRAGGAQAFFKGNFINVARTIPTKSIQFASFDAFKIALTRTNPVTGKKELPSWGSFAAGSLSGVVSTVATHPMETLQTRLAVSAAYKSAGDAVLSIMAKEGPLALFGGLGPSLIGIIPYAGLNLGFYDGMRTLYTKQTGKPVPKTASLVFGALAGASAASVTFPLEVVRRRMMMGQQFANTGAAIVAIAKAEGVGALFAGLGLNWVKVAPSSGLSIWSYELLKDQLKV